MLKRSGGGPGGNVEVGGKRNLTPSLSQDSEE